MSPVPDTRWEAFWRRHPRLLLGTVLALVLVVMFLTLRSYQPHVVLYRAF